MGFWDYLTTEHALPLHDRASCVKSDVSGSCPSKLFCAPITRCKAGLGATATHETRAPPHASVPKKEMHAQSFSREYSYQLCSQKKEKKKEDKNKSNCRFRSGLCEEWDVA